MRSSKPMEVNVNKIVLPVILGLGLTVALAQMQDARADSTGCGLGTTAWSGQSGIAPQVLAVTTNGTFGNQTFGISSGTLGCKSDDTIASVEVRNLTVANLDNLASDMARGEGETLASLAVAMRVQPEDQPLLFATFQENFTRIFPSDNASAEEVLVAMRDVMTENAVLKQYVTA